MSFCCYYCFVLRGVVDHLAPGAGKVVFVVQDETPGGVCVCCGVGVS